LARRKALAEKQAAQLGKELQRAARAKPAPSLAEVCRGLPIEAGNGESKIPERMPAPRDKVSAAAPHLGWTAATEIGTEPFYKLALPEANDLSIC